MSFRSMRKFGEPFGRALAPNATAKQRILAADPANLIGYWPLGDTSGSVADDVSATNADGAYAGTVTLAQPGIGDGSLSALFGGAGRVALTTPISAINTAFNPALGTILLWGKVSNWAAAAACIGFEFGADANNRVYISNDAPANRIQFAYAAGGATKSVLFSTTTPLWFVAALTWDKVNDAVKAYFNGAQTGSTQTSLGVWSGSLSDQWTALAGFRSTSNGNSWQGNLAHCALFKAALTPPQIGALYYPAHN